MSKSSMDIEYTCWRSTVHSDFRGKNTLYNTRKSNSYVLLDISSLSEQRPGQKKTIKIITNSEEILEKNGNIFRASLDKDKPNEKFIISKYLTSVLLSLPINRSARNKFYNRIRTLLLEKLVAIRNRKSSTLSNNRETSTFIRFSYRHRTWYLGFYIPCTICREVCSKVMSNSRTFCGTVHVLE